METFFWVLLVLSFYPYLIYPAAVYVFSRFMRRPWLQKPITPSVSLIISVYNEEKVIKQKIENALSLKYPEGLLEVIVVSDGSTDRSKEIARHFRDPRLSVAVFRERSGKTACLNRVIPRAKGEIIVFTDANSMFPADALLRMVRNFSDEEIGLVTGWTRYVRREGEVHVTSLYSRMEEKTKYWESLISCCVGADGAVFAIRKALYRTLGDEDINDFVTPLQVVSQGKRVVLDPEVYCVEIASEGGEGEIQRQARITNRTLLALRRNARFLNPFSFGLFSFFVLSHKLIRLLVPFVLSGMFILNLLLSGRSGVFFWLLMIQVSFVLIGLTGSVSGRQSKWLSLCKFVLMTLAAQCIGWLRMLREKADIMWIPHR